MISSTLLPHSYGSPSPARLTALAASGLVLATAALHLIPRLFQSTSHTHTHTRRPTRIVRFVDQHGITRTGEYIDEKTAAEIKGDVYSSTAYVTSRHHPIVSYLSPIAPTSILCIGLNYKSHVEESDMKLPKVPVLFMKNIAAASGHENNIVTPAVCEYKPQIDFEGELCVVIGRDACNVSEDDALDYVLGYTIGNDVSARDWQLNAEKSGSQWIRGKSFDTFAPFGPYLLLASSFPSVESHQQYLSSTRITTKLNDTIMQDGNTRNMLFDVKKLIAFASQGTTLVKGTVIMTGTPEGVGFARSPPVWMVAGDEISISISGLGTLTNYVVASCCGGKMKLRSY